MQSLNDSKKEARRKAAQVRKQAHAAWKDKAPLALASHDFPVALSPVFKTVAAFYPYQSEIDARPLLGKLAGEGWTTALPVVIALGEPLIFRRWFPGEPTVPGKWDIPQPGADAPQLEPDVLLVPLLAFDRRGYRLGYGGGFYDLTLEQLRARKNIIAIGLAYAAQETDAVPRDAQDQPLDYLMSEAAVIKFG